MPNNIRGTATDRVIGTVRKNRREHITVALRTFNSRHYVDVRVMATKSDGSIVPTRKGVTLQGEHLSNLVRLLIDAQSDWDAWHAS